MGSPAGWHPDPSGAPGTLRWWDGQAWTEHVHTQPAPGTPGAGAPVSGAQAVGSPLDAAVLVVGPPRDVSPGCRAFDLGDGAGGRLGRLVEMTRGTNDSAFGAALSRSRSWQHVTTREVRGARGYPELLLAWGPSTPGAIVATLPDRREVGRFVRGEAGWSVLGHDGRSWGEAGPSGMAAAGGSRLSEVTPDGGAGWRATVLDGPHPEPLRSLVAGAALIADVL